MNVRLVLSHSQPAFHLMDFGGKSAYHVRIKEDVLKVCKVKVASSEQLHLEKVLTASEAKFPLAHAVTMHFTLPAGASVANVDPLFTGQIPTDVIIGLVSNEAFVRSWTKSPFNFAHMDLKQACLVVDGCPLLAQPWQPDFTQGLYAETYHALLKSAGMYPSDWSNGLSWDLTPDDSDGTADLSPGHLGTVKASLRFTKPLPTTIALLAYAQYDNLVVVDVRVAISGGPHERALGGQGIGWCLRQERTLAPSHPVPDYTKYFDSYSTTPLESIYWRLWGMDYRHIRYSMKMLQRPFLRACGLYAFYSLAMRSQGVPLGPSPLHSGNMISLTMRPRSDAFWDKTHPHAHIYSDSDHGLSLDRLSTSEIQWNTWTLLLSLPWTLRHHHARRHLWPRDPVALPLPCARGVTTWQRLATALAALILLTPVLLFVALDSQWQAWKHPVPLTVQNITDAGSPIWFVLLDMWILQPTRHW